MTQTGQNIEMFQGETKILIVNVTDGDNNPVDLTDSANITWVLFKASTGEVKLTKTLTSGITILDPTEGVFRILIQPNDTINTFGDLNHECKIIDVSLSEAVIFTGKAKLYSSKLKDV